MSSHFYREIIIKRNWPENTDNSHPMPARHKIIDPMHNNGYWVHIQQGFRIFEIVYCSCDILCTLLSVAWQKKELKKIISTINKYETSTKDKNNETTTKVRAIAFFVCARSIRSSHQFLLLAFCLLYMWQLAFVLNVKKICTRMLFRAHTEHWADIQLIFGPIVIQFTLLLIQPPHPHRRRHVPYSFLYSILC